MNIRKRSFLGMAVGLMATTALVGGAFAQDGSVVIYTAHKASIVDTLLPLFEQETGLKAEVVKLGSSDVFKRARAEAGAPAADVIWSVTGSQLTENKDLLEAYQPADFDKVDQQFVVDPSWTPYTAVVYVLAVNTDMLPLDQAPKTWAELVDPKWKGQIVSARADGSGSAMQQLQTVLTVFGDEGWDKYTQLASNFVFSDSSGAVPRFVADGEASMGLTLEDNALEYVQGGAPMGIVHLTDGTAATPDGVALVKGGPNPEGGKKFIDWAMSKSTQEKLAMDIGRRSVRTDVAGPAGTPNLSDLQLIKVKPLADFGGVDEVLAKWRTAIGE
ncbi:extracellular solute-binding protein [Paradevosia shaoguanensis]|uniref:Extracellular solute-binding protein n=2 Tax=Paradevosia shaoguanensis TaxID=1335043 RepID=A0AA41QM29_9HYPH|nr:extracellular solute-binding protein [Paradevosia shaoguanensis]MCF1742194.1 extracellular solute-binding protein [Paradevosia shaoguanensis]MCI0126677.1 extracellular solute-binding protein [Paradevosia shaoguanensis]QMV02424.1 extracellular solute-binding protein [Devosia sp. D6-9]CDP52052.1 Ferric iron ABC transporter, iron-binding protein [Devosia sp. DBB001]